jgi:ubiquinone/menaquinone biosynthesis C-methylase UbiE
MPKAPGEALRQQFGDIDIYLFDQILRGRFDMRQRVLDAGCGDGRNLISFLQQGFDCHGVDSEPEAIALIRQTAARLAPDLPATNFVVADVAHLPYPDEYMPAVICSAVLHFAEDETQFRSMVDEMWRVLAPKGLFFARLASNIGMEDLVGPAGRQVRLPDGTDRFLVDEAMLLRYTDRLGGRLADPIKTTNVQRKRCMTTWCAVKG